MFRSTKTIAAIVLFIGVVSILAAQSQRRTIAVVYQPPGQDIPDFSLIEKLVESLTVRAELKVILPGEDSTLPPPPNNRFDFERLYEWGSEIGSRYIVYLHIDDRRVAVRKQPSIPWLLSRYVVEGHLNGIYSLIDLNRNKVVGTWELSTKLSGPRQWQVARDYPDDPDLQMSAPSRMLFLKKLEQKAVEEIIEAIRPHLKGR